MLTLEEVLAADERIRDAVRWTPLERSYSFSEETGADLALKLENIQRTGAFKIRGALNRIETLDDERKQAGVITASAGNHAQGGGAGGDPRRRRLHDRDAEVRADLEGEIDPSIRRDGDPPRRGLRRGAGTPASSLKRKTGRTSTRSATNR